MRNRGGTGATGNMYISFDLIPGRLVRCWEKRVGFEMDTIAQELGITFTIR
jgi:hypothetical protein